MTTKNNQLNEYLTFEFGRETFAMEISNVKEVINYTKITRVPRLPKHLSGVINLRGNIVSIMDVRIKLGINIKEKTPDTCIIVVEMQNNEEIIQTGIPIDSVKEVIHLSESQIESTPKVGMKNDKPLLILDIEKILDDESVL